MDIVDIYAGYTTTDERGSLGDVVCYSLDKRIAKNLVKGKGFYGGDGRVEKIHSIKMDGFYFLLKQKEPITETQLNKSIEDATKKALDKLTEEDKKVLGLK